MCELWFEEDEEAIVAADDLGLVYLHFQNPECAEVFSKCMVNAWVNVCMHEHYCHKCLQPAG